MDKVFELNETQYAAFFDRLMAIKEDAERRIGSYIAGGSVTGDVYEDSYVKKQIAVISNADEAMSKLIESISDN